MDGGPDMDSLLDELERSEYSKATVTNEVVVNELNNPAAPVRERTLGLKLVVNDMPAISKCLNDSSPSPPIETANSAVEGNEECFEPPSSPPAKLPVEECALNSDVELENSQPASDSDSATVVLPISNADGVMACFEAPPEAPSEPLPPLHEISPAPPLAETSPAPIDVYDEIEQMERLIRAESTEADTGTDTSLPDVGELTALTATSAKGEMKGVVEEASVGMIDVESTIDDMPAGVHDQADIVEEVVDSQPPAADDNPSCESLVSEPTAPAAPPPSNYPGDGEERRRVSVVASLHMISSEDSEEHRLTESELMLGKTKPFWIPDADCASCMLCTRAFTLVNRRHHCRSCGRLLCGACCSTRRRLPYMKEDERKQRICAPCNKTLDRIESHERERRGDLAGEEPESAPNPTASSSVDVNPSTSTETVSGSVDANQPHGTSPSSTPAGRKKKSVLKARQIPISGIPEDEAVPDGESSSSSTAAPHPISASLPIIAPGLESQESSGEAQFSRSVSTQQPKRSVTFRDGVNPGDESAESSVRQTYHQPGSSSLDERDETLMILNGGLLSRSKKQSKRLSRRAIERRADEEQTSLLPATADPPCRCYLLGPNEEFNRGRLDEVTERIHSRTEAITIVLKRNLYVVVRRGERDSKLPVIAYFTRGFNAIGVDELVLVIEHRGEIDDDSTRRPEELLEVLLQMEEVFAKCLAPTDDTLDDRMGIRRCVKRMVKLYSIGKGRIGGVEAAAVLFHRPRGQSFGSLLSDVMPEGTPFLVGTLLKQEELAWAIALPNRVLMRIGLHASCYPVPVVNRRERPSLFERIEETGHSSVLKIFTDFHTWSYRMTKLPGSTASLTDKSTTLTIPEWGRDELRTIVENNRSMVGWALDFNDGADSHLVCEQSGCDFKTKVFTNSGQKRSVTGANFVIFDGALKRSGEDGSFVASVVEDGVIVRLSADTMEELVKSLLAGEDFKLTTASARLEVLFRPSAAPLHTQGALTSPIDRCNLEGNYEYGLVMSRQFRSHNPLPTISEWSLRLSSVVNMDRGKFPHILQPKYFELCEQLATHITPTLEPFISSLMSCHWRRICVRVRVEEECVSYETEKWDGEELADQHFIWTLALDEQLVPFLYSLCAVAPSGFNVEMHMSIISTKPLPTITAS